MELSVTGKIKLINETQTFPSGFTKREFVVTTAEQYPQDIKFEMIKDKISALDKYRAGDELKVSFNIRGNEYQGKYFVNLQAWKLEGISSAPASEEPVPAEIPDTMLPPEEKDDLPF